MRRLILATGLTCWLAIPGTLQGQFGGGFGGERGRFGRGPDRDATASAPKLPGAELDGPPDSSTIRGFLDLTDAQAGAYAQAYDSFMVATRPQRDSARVVADKMNQRLDGGDRAAALFYAERLNELGKVLRERQARFENLLGKLLTPAQVKSYRQWRDQQDRVDAERQREDALRWRIMPDGIAAQGGFQPRRDEPKTTLVVPGVEPPAIGAQVVRVGRSLYVATQLPLDSTGGLVGAGDLGRQAKQAFTNLSTVLHGAHVNERDVVELTIYVVDYHPSDLSAIRNAAAELFPPRSAPAVTVLGVQALATEGARIGVAAMALAGSAGTSGDR
jgi:enamine deaminase RidA (YjgF/YER057c/UK114 family)/Spy/CpxP family protein refolding chaperone